MQRLTEVRKSPYLCGCFSVLFIRLHKDSAGTPLPHLLYHCKNKTVLFCISLDLHYLCKRKKNTQMKKLSYIFLTLLVLAGCTGTSRQPQLVAMDSLLLSRPDSALTLLRGMSFTDKADRMYHYLLLADACNKCYDILPSDTILQEVADYYDRHGTANEQVRAHYLLGCAYRDEGNAPLALNIYNSAIEKADTNDSHCDFRTISMVYGQMALLFHLQRAPRLEIEARKNAIDYSWKAKDTLSAITFHEYLSGAYHMLNMLDSALYYNHKAAQMYKDINRYDLASGTLGLDIDIYLRKKDYENTKRALDEYEQKSLNFKKGEIRKGMEVFYTYKGEYYEKTGNLDSAMLLYQKALFSNPNMDVKESAYKGFLSLYQKLNNGDSIAKYSELYCQTNDSSSFTHSADEITRMQAIYNYDESERRAKQEEKKADNYRKLIFIIVLLAVISGYFTIRFVKHQKQLRRKELIKANTAYSTLLAKYSQAQKDLIIAKHGLNNYRMIKEQEILSLQQELSLFQEEAALQKKWDEEHAMLHDEIVQHLHKIASRAQKASAMEWQDLNRFALDRLPSFVNKICDESLNLTDKELRVCILTRLQFIPTELIALFDLSKQRISNLRASANRKLFNNEDTYTFDNNIHKL